MRSTWIGVPVPSSFVLELDTRPPRQLSGQEEVTLRFGILSLVSLAMIFMVLAERADMAFLAVELTKEMICQRPGEQVHKLSLSFIVESAVIIQERNRSSAGFSEYCLV